MKENILMVSSTPTLTQSSRRFEKVLGSELKRFDTIKVWWSGGERLDGHNTDTIVKIKKYDGPLNYLHSKGAQVAKFIVTSMTIVNSDYYERLIEDE